MLKFDISEVEYCEEDMENCFEADAEIWGDEASVLIDLDEVADGEPQQKLEELWEQIARRLEWVEENRQAIESAIIADGMTETANDWAASGEPEDEDDEDCKVFYDEEGEKMVLPVTDADLTRSLHQDELTVSVEADGSIELTLYLVTKPAYFTDHAIEIAIDSKNNVECCGLAG